MNSSYQEARKLFPKMPEEIFKLWLYGRIDSNGWPPQGVRWDGALRLKTLSYWGKLNWKKSLVKLDMDSLTESSQKIIQGLVFANFCGIKNDYSDQMGDDSKKRIEQIISYAEKHSKLPNSLIFIYENGKYEIVDGCHRLATFFWKNEYFPSDLLHDAWIGEIDK
jgi:hypothetical protein